MLEYLIIAGGAVALIVIIGMIWAALYKRASKDTALIRTGAGGQKIVTDGGIAVVPVIHEIQAVDLTTTKIEVRRQQQDSLITKDKIRVDVQGLFHIRVAPNADYIARAAQSLGSRVNEKDAVKELLEGKLVSALRSAAAKMTMEDLHANRQDFIAEVSSALKDELPTNGFELEGVAITTLNQTNIEFLDENNAFDAEGLTAITRTIEDRKKVRNDIQAENRVAIEQRNYEAQQQSLEIARKQEFAALEQRQQIEEQTAKTDAFIASQQAESTRSQEEARLAAEEAVKAREIAKDRTVKERQVEADRSVQEATIAQQVAVQNKSKEESEARAEADRARAEAVTAAQSVITAEETAKAERAKQVAVIAARQEAEQNAVGITVQAEAEKQAAQDKAEAIKIAASAAAESAVLHAKGESDAEKLRAAGIEALAQAEGLRVQRLNEARNIQSESSMTYERQMKLTEVMPDIIAAAVKPMEKIDGIKIFQVGGIGGTTSNVSYGPDGSVVSNGGGSSGNLAQDALNAALAYRAQSPAIDHLTSQIFGDIDVGTVEGLVNAATGAQPKKAPAPPAAPAPAAPRIVASEPDKTIDSLTSQRSQEPAAGFTGRRRDQRGPRGRETTEA